jgi:hypothetical protein
MDAVPQKQISLVRSMIEEEANNDWARLYRVPSTYTWRCLDYILSLDDFMLKRMYDGIAERAPYHLGSLQPPIQWDDQTLSDFYDQVWRRPSQHVSSRLLRGMRASLETDGPEGYFASMPAELIARAAAIKPTNAKDIRKTVKRAFGERYRCNPINISGGVWKYTGEFASQPVTVRIDYGGQGDQLRYWVELHDAENGIQTKMLNYESLIGMGHGHWDFVTADNLDESVHLLCELIETIVKIPERLSDIDIN